MFGNNTSYEFTEIKLTEDEFKNLVFMGPPPIWEKYKNDTEDLSFLYNLCFKPLKDVAQKVVNRYNQGRQISNPTEVFQYLNDQNIRAKKMMIVMKIILGLEIMKYFAMVLGKK